MEYPELIKVEDLVDCLEKHMREERSCRAPDREGRDDTAPADRHLHLGTTDIWAHGMQKKWLEPQDLSDRDALLERRQAARILHEFLRKELREPDLAEWDPAKILLDLYDCRACVNHVAQVYSKGIMEGITEHIFGMREGVLREELDPMAERVFCRDKRIVR